MDFVLHLTRFEGPLDLLLYLIEKNRFTIEDLEVCPIVDQYLGYINTLRSLDVTLAGEFLDMASYLIWLKSCLLLPRTAVDASDEELNPARQLQEMLLAYRAIKLASRELADRPQLFRDRFPRGRIEGGDNLAPMSMASLLQAIAAIRSRTRRYVLSVAATQYSIREMMARIFGMLRQKDRLALNEVLQSQERSERISVLLAALELSKTSVASLLQRRLFAEIFIVKRPTAAALAPDGVVPGEG